MTKKTDYRFKLLYALATVFVLLCHTDSGGLIPFHQFFPGWVVHLPIFMFASGFFFKENASDDVRGFIWKKLTVLLFPVLAWNVFYGLFCQVGTLFGYSYGYGVKWEYYLVEPFLKGRFVYNMGAWYVIPLLILHVYNVLIYKLTRKVNPLMRDSILLIVAFAIGLLGVWLSYKGYTNDWWLLLMRVMYFAPFYAAGIFYGRHIHGKISISNTVYFGCVFLASVILFSWAGKTPRCAASLCGFDDKYLFVYPMCFLSIAFWLRVAKILDPVIGRSRVVNLIADNSFAIMIHQFLGFMTAKWVISKVYLHTAFCQNFDWIAFHKNIWYNYRINNVSLSLVVYVIFAIVVSVLIQYAWSKFYQKITNLYLRVCVMALLLGAMIGASYGINDYVRHNGGVKVPEVSSSSIGG